MTSPKVLLYGNNDRLLQLLRTSGGAALQVESVSDSTHLQARQDSEEAGMIVIVHTPPKTDGFAALRNWKRKNPDVPAIVITSDYSGPTTRLLLKSGAEDVLGFPANSEDILACYEAYLPGFKLKPSVKKYRPIRGLGSKALLAAVTPGMVVAGVQFSGYTPPETPFYAPPLLEQDNEEAYRGLEISFFGPFTIQLNGKKIELTNQAKYLFAYLVYHYPRALSRDHLARTFWADKFESMPDFARKSLNVELTHIRKSFRNQTGSEKDMIVFEKNAYRLKLDHPLISDVLTFKALHQKIQEHKRRGEEIPDDILQKAIKTYRGNFLDDFPTDMFSWIEIEQQHLSSVFEQIADLYSEQLCAKNDYWKAIAVCNEILSRDSRMEVIHRRAIQCYASLGMAHKVEAQYNLCCKMMEQEFQSKPSPETTRLYDMSRA